MQKLIFIVFFLITMVSNSQQLTYKKFKVSASTIEIDTKGLDEIIIENSNDAYITISLDEENAHAHYIFTEEEKGYLTIDFEPEIKPKETVFRKFITERLNRARVKMSIPKNKNLSIIGNDVDIISENYVGNYAVFIHKGTLNFKNLTGNLQLSLFSGSVFFTTSEGEITIKSSKGKIKIDDKMVFKSFQKTLSNSKQKVEIKSIQANITLTTKKTQ